MSLRLSINPTCRLRAAATGLAVTAITLLLLCSTSFAQSKRPPARWRPIEQALGTSGKMLPGGVMEIDLPRTDLNVIVHGIPIRPSFDETDLRFMQSKGRTIVDGEIALVENEVDSVVSRLLLRGYTVSAIHSHLLAIQPRIIYIHFMGSGQPAAVASALRYIFAGSSTPLGTSGNQSNTGSGIDTRQIDKIFGEKGEWIGGVYDISVARREKIKMSGIAMPSTMGLEHEFSFQPTGGGRAAVTGEIVLIAKEVNPVIRSLRDKRIQVTALHNHWLADQPHLFYVHFWANDDAARLARELHATLGRTNSK
ncbi:MAG: DUF1259 domain-containing protein [Armatimonadota bacterium]|nr:DUF1259 domain-containing protein [bacterium]